METLTITEEFKEPIENMPSWYDCHSKDEHKAELNKALLQVALIHLKKTDDLLCRINSNVPYAFKYTDAERDKVKKQIQEIEQQLNK